MEHKDSALPFKDSDSSRMSSSRTFQTQKNSNSGPSLLKLRSPFSSLFSFRKSKQDEKAAAPPERHNIFSSFHRTPPSFQQVKKKFEIYQSARSVKQLASFFEAQHKKASENVPSSTQLEKEVIQVLGDLDQTLAEEQVPHHEQRSRVLSWQHGNRYSKENAVQNSLDSQKDSNHDGTTTVETRTTHATYHPRRIFELYSGKRSSASKPETTRKNDYRKNIEWPPASAQGSGKFSSSSLDIPTVSLQVDKMRPRPRRIPITSIKWNRASTSVQAEEFSKPSRSQSAMDLTNIGVSTQQNRMGDFYKYDKPNKGSSSSTNDFCRVNYPKDPTSTFHNNSGNCSTSFDETDSSRLGPVMRFPTQTKSEWRENKENAFMSHTVTSQPSSSCSEREEPMETETEYVALDKGIVCRILENAEDFILTRSVINPQALNAQKEDISTIPEIIKDSVTPENNEMHWEQNSHTELPETRTNITKPYSKISVQSESTPMEFPTATFPTVPKVMPVSGHYDIKATSKEPTYLASSTLPFSNQDLTWNSSEGSVGNDLSKTDHSKEPTYLTSSTLPVSNQDLIWNSSEGAVWNDISKTDHSKEATYSASSTLQVTNQDRPSNGSEGSVGNDLSKTDHSKEPTYSASSTLPVTNQDLTWSSSEGSVWNDISKTDPSSSWTTFFNTKDWNDPCYKNVTSQPADIGCNLEKIHLRRSSNDNILEGFKSDVLTHQRRNASSLPDLLDQADDQINVKMDSYLTKNHKELTSNNQTFYYLSKPYRFSSGLFVNGKSQKTLADEVRFDGEEPSHLPEVNATRSNLQTRYKSMHLTGGHLNYSQSGSDKNNNRPLTKNVQIPEEFSRAESQNVTIHQESNNSITETLENDIPSIKKSDLPKTEDLEQKMDQHFSKPFTTQETDTLHKVKNIIAPISQKVEEQLQNNSSIQANLGNMSANLLKEHLLLAPEPFKRNVNNENSTTPFIFPRYSKEEQTPNISALGSRSSNLVSHFTSESTKSSESKLNSTTYACQKITESSQIYEAQYTDSSQPDVDTIEYHKVVSIYYTLPRKYSRKLSEVSQNNLKNLDRTFENRKEPSMDTKVNMFQGAGTFSYQNVGKTSPSQYSSDNVVDQDLYSDNTLPCDQHIYNVNLLPWQTNRVNTPKSSPREEKTSPDFDLADAFSSLHISEKGGHRGQEDFQRKRNLRNRSKYSPTRTSPSYAPNYYTLPSRRSSLQDLERSLLDDDIAMARDRYNFYSSRGNVLPTTPEQQEVFLSPTYGFGGPNLTSGYDSSPLQQVNGPQNNMDGFVNNDYVNQKDYFDGCTYYTEDNPSFYRAKSPMDLKRQDSHSPRDPWYGVESKVSPPLYNHPNAVNRTRPSYCSEFVQKKMKPIKAKKFTFSFDSTDQKDYSRSRSTESFGDSPKKSDVDLTSVFYSPSDGDLLSENRNNNFRRSPTECGNDQQLYRSKSLKLLNNGNQAMDNRINKSGNFSSKSYGENLKSRRPSSYVDSGHDRCSRSYSAEIIDENDNWRTSNMGYNSKPVCTSKSVDYGIFGKEQQEAILNNVKRSLTEGRLWRPSLLKAPSFLRNEEQLTSQESQPTSCRPDNILKGSLNIYEGELPPDSDLDSDIDTTTDDEYYLDENDKESEL